MCGMDGGWCDNRGEWPCARIVLPRPPVAGVVAPAKHPRGARSWPLTAASSDLTGFTGLRRTRTRTIGVTTGRSWRTGTGRRRAFRLA